MIMDDGELLEYLRDFLRKHEEDANENEEGCCYMCDRIRDEIVILEDRVGTYRS